MAITKNEFLNKKCAKNNENELSQKECFSSTFQKSSPIKLLRRLIENNEDTNVQIKIGDWTFDCHLMVLQCYSELFKRHSFERGTTIELPKEQVSSNTFVKIYKWMLEDNPTIQRTEVIEVLVSACYLEIEQLIAQIWNCLNDVEEQRGDAAYFLYLEANILNVKCIRELMLLRISKFFLIMVAFKEFLLMPVEDLCTLLSSDLIGVNTEIETFMAALRWLSYDWSKRKRHIFAIMKKIRFYLIPPGFLVELDRNMIDNCIIKRVMARKKVRDLVNNGLKYATTRLCYGKFIEQNGTVIERHWIYDENCEYHIKANQLIEYKINYSKFLEYLKYLQKCDQNYWRSFAYIKNEIPSLSRCSERPEWEISEIVKETAYTCIIKEVSETDITHQNLTAITPDIIVEESITSSQDSVLNVREPAVLSLEKYGVQSVECQHKNDTMEISCQQMSRRGYLTHRIERPFVMSPRSEQCALEYKREISSSECSFETFASLDYQNQNENQSHISEKEQQLSDDPLKDDVDQSEVNSDTNSFISMISLDPQSKSDNRESRSFIMSVKSMSKKSISIESFKNDTNKQCGRIPTPTKCEESFITARHHKFEFKGVKFEQMLNNLSMSSRKASLQITAQNKTTASINQKPDKVERKESLMNEGAGDAPVLLNTSIRAETLTTLYESIFNNKTLLILGGTDPYRQHYKWSIDFKDKILFYGNRFRKWAQVPHSSFGTRQHHEVVVCNGFVYIIGGTKVIPGCKKTFFETSIWALNIKTKIWTFETNLPKNRRDFAVVAVDGELNEPGFFIIGGESFDRVPLNSVWFYNITKKVWLRKAPLNTPRYGFSAAIVKNEIWIAGGIAYSSNLASNDKSKDQSSRSYTEFITDTIETFKLNNVFNNNRGKWIESKYKLRQRCLFGKLLATKDNKLYLIGGIGNDLKEDFHSFDAIDHFDFDAEKWVQCGKLQFARHGHDIVLIDNLIAIIGGVSSNQKCALQSIEFFCLKTAQIFKPIPDLPRPLSGLGAVIIDVEW